ncbi:hypothetical protein [Bacillus altitudinis]|uniref:hypothetical protein n=1 Tax=Bacillus altitudinis TaxID=293387 RepID=UPI00067FDE0F|nr:hypothetical protein [Bacillus altitudinis]AKU30240.1 hypothetical protein ID12_01845 [Bacillus altitudinis]MBL7243947.1 hypothetical protein [Bacillus altitudinis]MBR0631784.1 hypothetical protein [Bacillus altitudinis C101]QAR52013.1 hypothetical protein BAE_04055 [Bacillus aerophilus]
MKKSTEFRCNLDISIVEQVNKRLLENGYSENATGIKNNKGEIIQEQYKWNFLMACLTRVKEIGMYLNSSEMKIDFEKDYVEFKFIELLNYASQIEMITNQLIANLSKEEFKKPQVNDFFVLDDFRRKYGMNTSGDSQFVEYIRSLCAIHPTETNRHKKRGFQSGLEFSPYVSKLGKSIDLMRFPLVINTSSTTEELSSSCISITVYPGEKNISEDQTSKKTEINKLFAIGVIDKEEYDIMFDRIEFGGDFHIIVNVKDLICFIESSYSRLEVLI